MKVTEFVNTYKDEFKFKVIFSCGKEIFSVVVRSTVGESWITLRNKLQQKINEIEEIASEKQGKKIRFFTLSGNGFGTGVSISEK